MTLAKRTDAALDYLYTKKDMAQLLKVLWDLGKSPSLRHRSNLSTHCVQHKSNLDISTRLSAECCDTLLVDGSRCPMILLDLVSRCNRSVPHQEVISAVFDVLINLSR